MAEAYVTQRDRSDDPSHERESCALRTHSPPIFSHMKVCAMIVEIDGKTSSRSTNENSNAVVMKYMRRCFSRAFRAVLRLSARLT